jgi:DNA-3-methyladenine glycosylase I
MVEAHFCHVLLPGHDLKKEHMKKTIVRCPWTPEGNPLLLEYHDNEWGVPVHDDQKHFEFLILEGAQAGLNWLTILQRRIEYAKAFAHFDVAEVAQYDKKKIEELLSESGIIRNRLKIESAITNAQRFIDIQQEFGSFDRYVWLFVDNKPIVNHRKSLQDIPPSTKESESLSRDLKKRGFKFVGPTIMYAYMQAVGLVNDHLIDCFRYRSLVSLSW